jgi:hypothetical protein
MDSVQKHNISCEIMFSYLPLDFREYWLVRRNYVILLKEGFVNIN